MQLGVYQYIPKVLHLIYLDHVWKDDRLEVVSPSLVLCLFSYQDHLM